MSDTGLNLVGLTSSNTNLASVMCTDLLCPIIELNIVVLTSSSRYLASGICTDLIESNTGTQGSSTDL